MKRTLFSIFGLLVIFFYSCGTKKNKDAGQPKIEYIIAMTGFDSLKLGMTKAELESMLHTTFKLKHITVDGGASDTFSVKYKGMDVTIYLNEGDEKSIATLFGVQSGDSSFRTNEGIGVGTEKSKVLNAYEDFTKYIAPEYEVYPERSKTKSVVAVVDTFETKAILFHILNRKISSVEVCSYYEFY